MIIEGVQKNGSNSLEPIGFYVICARELGLQEGDINRCFEYCVIVRLRVRLGYLLTQYTKGIRGKLGCI